MQATLVDPAGRIKMIEEELDHIADRCGKMWAEKI